MAVFAICASDSIMCCQSGSNAWSTLLSRRPKVKHSLFRGSKKASQTSALQSVEGRGKVAHLGIDIPSSIAVYAGCGGGLWARLISLKRTQSSLQSGDDQQLVIKKAVESAGAGAPTPPHPFILKSSFLSSSDDSSSSLPSSPPSAGSSSGSLLSSSSGSSLGSESQEHSLVNQQWVAVVCMSSAESTSSSGGINSGYTSSGTNSGKGGYSGPDTQSRDGRARKAATTYAYRSSGITGGPSTPEDPMSDKPLNRLDTAV
ncbi:hypothetical protein Tco_0466355 [Tanacetum coccineum]